MSYVDDDRHVGVVVCVPSCWRVSCLLLGRRAEHLLTESTPHQNQFLPMPKNSLPFIVSLLSGFCPVLSFAALQLYEIYCYQSGRSRPGQEGMFPIEIREAIRTLSHNRIFQNCRDVLSQERTKLSLQV